MDDQDLLYHYTSGAGLVGLLGNPRLAPTMWLTQLQYMNDESEYHHAYELVTNRLFDLRSECPRVYAAMGGLFGIPYGNEPIQQSNTDAYGFARYFSFSLSEERDLLSQWRAYAADGGYSIGFRFGDLRNLSGAQCLSLTKCVYDDNQKYEYISAFIQKIEAGILANDVADDIGVDWNSIPDIADHPTITARVRIQNEADAISRYFKHSSFAEEREWRIVGAIPADDPRAKWRTRGNDIIPYCELSIGPTSATPLPAIKIFLGPGQDVRRATHAIEFMNFATFGSVEIIPSRSTLKR